MLISRLRRPHGVVRFLPLCQGPLAGVVERQGREQADEHQNVQHCPDPSGQGGGARPRLTGKRGYHPLLAVAAGRHVLARLREGQGGAGLPGPGDNSRCGPRRASATMTGRRMDVRFSITIRHPAQSHRGRLGMPRRASRTPHRCGSSAHARFPVGPLRHLQITASSPTGRGKPSGGRPSAPRRDPRPQVRRGVEPSPLGPLPRQRRLAGGLIAHKRRPPRSGRADRDHQDPATPLLFHGRKAHPTAKPD